MLSKRQTRAEQHDVLIVGVKQPQSAQSVVAQEQARSVAMISTRNPKIGQAVRLIC
jgi:hypothetical protein